jgi:hypothetical protein
MYAKWLENVNKNTRVKFVPTGLPGSCLCSKHFSSDMKEESGQKVILKPFAVPTIFPTSPVCAFVSFLHHLIFKRLTCFYPEHVFVDT